MSFSYVASQLAESPLYQVRFRLGDTEEASAAFQDEEISFLLQQSGGNVLRACIACVEALLPRLATTSEFSVGPYSEKQGSSAYDYWSKLLDQLRGQITGYSAPIAFPPQGGSYFYYGMMGTEASNATDP